ncbi:hypothetical protein KPH14_008359 [Odynerus spinipes]|uniref:Coiled-coil-helix-coiled-coil-helix domain-containing protein 7 n=1 Tax=Odynerus spinipes TaxID=1348599 RepID=A0AAD9VU12_9HYME|nr:hypothetical protein KPH14_008359 [Odynerus spinipes]
MNASDDKMKEHKLKRDQAINNPCLKEHDLSLQCLNDNNYIPDACTDYFENYRTCKHFWQRVTADRKSKNIKPFLPPVEERIKIKNEYLKSGII